MKTSFTQFVLALVFVIDGCSGIETKAVRF